MVEARRAEMAAALAKAEPLAAVGRFLDAARIVEEVELTEHSALAAEVAETRRRIAEYPALREQAIKDAKTAADEVRRLLAARRIDAAHARLQRVPVGFHTPEMKQLAGELGQLVAEAKQLRQEIAAALAAKQYDGLLPQVERLASLYPDDPQPQALLKRIQDYQRKRDAAAGTRYLQAALAAIAKCDYARAGAAVEKIPADVLADEAVAAKAAAIRERAFLYQQLQREPYATAVVVKMAERLAKLQPSDARIVKMASSAQQRYAAGNQPGAARPAAWAKPPERNNLGMPVDLTPTPTPLLAAPGFRRELGPQLLVAYGLALQAAGQAGYPLHLTPQEKKGTWRALAPKLRSTKTQPTGWGVDVGSRMLKAVQVGLADGQLAVLRVHHAPLPRSGDAAEAISQFVAEHDLSSCTVAINLPSTQTLVRIFAVPAPKPEKFREAVAFELKARIPLAEDQALHDFHWSPVADDADDAPSAMMRRVLLVAAARNHVAQRLEPWRDSGAGELLVVSDSVALANGLVGPLDVGDEKPKGKHAPPPAPMPEHVAGRAFLETGASTFNLVAFTPAGLWCRGLYLGTEGLDKAVAADRQLPLEEAETLRRQPYRAAAMHQLHAALAGELDRLQASIHRATDQLAAETAFTPRQLQICGGLAHQLGFLQRLQRDE